MIPAQVCIERTCCIQRILASVALMCGVLSPGFIWFSKANGPVIDKEVLRGGSATSYSTTVSAAPCAAQSDESLILKIESTINHEMNKNGVPGLALGITKEGRVLCARGFGVQRIGENQPVTARTMFHMASVTKLFVATAIMQLEEEGRLRLEDRVVDHIPYFRLADRRYMLITVRELLNHTSGMPDVDDYHWDKPEYDDRALERYVRGLAGLHLVSPPGKEFHYSNIGYEILGDLISQCSGESFERYVDQRVLKPVGMDSSSLLLRAVNAHDLASPHVADKLGRIVVSNIFPYSRPHAASSTLYSNVNDMNRWALVSMNRGMLGTVRILKASSYSFMWDANVEVPEDPDFPGKMTVGLGWFQFILHGHKVMVHPGDDVGFQSIILLVPDEHTSVVLMTNCNVPRFSVVNLGVSLMDSLLRRS